jgi:hypothetical protein
MSLYDEWLGSLRQFVAGSGKDQNCEATHTFSGFVA